MPSINDNTLDNGLAALKASADRVFLCSAEPATFTAASSTVKLAEKLLAAGAVFPGAIAAGTPSGRKLTTVAVTDGDVTATGVVSHWATASSVATRLETAQALAATQSVTITNKWSMPAADVRLAGTGG